MPQKLNNPSILDLSEPAKVVMLERMFGVDNKEFYTMRRLGQLPPNAFDKENPASYEDCLRWMMQFLKGRAALDRKSTRLNSSH